VIDEVIKNILPPGAMESMRAIGDQMRAAEAMGEDKPIDSLFKDFDERTAERKANGNGHAEKDEILANGAGGFGKAEDEGDVVGVSAEVQDEIRRAAQGKDRFECDVCRYVAKGKPAKCPVCGSGPTHFHAVDAGIATTNLDDVLNVSEVYDGRELHWTDDARALLDSLEEWQEQRRVKARVEKSALKKGYTTITREYVEQQYREETGREAPKVEAPKASACPVSHAKRKVQETSGGKCPIDHSAFQKAGALVPEGGSREFTWTQEAIDRLERAPKGFMRNISRNMTEKLARERGVTHIDLALTEDSLSGARTTMEDVITGKISIAELAKDTGESMQGENGEAPHPPMTVTMVCGTCGEEMQGIQPPEECPVCGAPGEDFEAK
jgi:rubrerythrin